MVNSHQLTDFLPTTKKEVELKGWDELDVILFSGDAYVDHPSFGAAVIGRVLESKGYRVAIVPQPDWHGDFRDVGYAPKMPTVLTDVTTVARNIPPSSIHRFYANCIPMSP